MKMELINKVNNTNTKSKTYALGLAFALTAIFIFIGYVFFANILNLFIPNIEDLINYKGLYYYGIKSSTFDIVFPIKMFIYFEIIFSPILFIFLYRSINKGVLAKYIIIICIGSLALSILLLSFMGGTLSELLLSSFFTKAPSVVIYLIILLLITIGIRFIHNKKRLFGLSLVGIPLYFILQLTSPVVIFSEIDFTEVNLNLTKYEDFEKVQAKNILIGANLNSINSVYVKKLSVQEDFEKVKYYNFINKLDLTLPQYISSSEAYFLLTKENINSLCFQFKKVYWDKCISYIENDRGTTLVKIFNKELAMKIDTLVSEIEINSSQDYGGSRGFFPTIEDDMLDRQRGWLFHHHQNFESPLYGLPQGKLPPSQYGPLGLALMDYISSTFIAPFSENNNIFSLTIGAVQLFNILGYLIILLLLALLRINSEIKTIVSLSVLSGLVILLETSDAFAPGLNLFRSFPQLILVVFAFSQLSLKQHSVYLSIPFVSIFIFPLLALYNEQFALFTVVSAAVSLMFSGKARVKFLTIFFVITTLILYWSFIKEYFVYMDASSNARMLNYITGLGWDSAGSYSQAILLGFLIISPLFYILITYSKDNKRKVNSIFVVMLSVLMFSKYIWNPSINHLASVLPFAIFPFIILFFEKNLDNHYADLVIAIQNSRHTSTIRKKFSSIDFTSNLRILKVLKIIAIKVINSFRKMMKILSSQLKRKSSVSKNTIFTLSMLLMISLMTVYSAPHSGQNLYKYKYINSFNTDEFFYFPRRVFIDSSFDTIVNDYSSLIENIDREVILMTKHDVMISMSMKKKIGSPYSDFSTNIVFQKDVDTVSDFLTNKNYCLVLDRRDQFYYLPYASETDLSVLKGNDKSRLNTFSVFEKIKPTLKFIDQSKYFELHCSVLPKKTNP